MAGKKVGRKKILPTPEMLKKIEQYASQGMTIEQICPLIGMSHETFNNRKNEYPEFADAIKRGLSAGINLATTTLTTLMAQGNLGATCFYLKCKGGFKENDPQIAIMPRMKLIVDGKTVEMD